MRTLNPLLRNGLTVKTSTLTLRSHGSHGAGAEEQQDNDLHSSSHSFPSFLPRILVEAESRQEREGDMSGKINDLPGRCQEIA